uniref:Putative secreted protein n=1 Tax=Ixodes ricinus TaxID=34613 RepID=V5GL50_IXORI
MLSLSKMQLVVFAVALILPALQSGGLLSGTRIYDDCVDILDRCGRIKCYLQGSGDFKTSDPRESLRIWEQGLQTALNAVLRTWCPYFPKE